MLPERLQRSERPAESLADQRGRGFRSVRPADGFFLVIDLPARAADGDGQVGIFRHGVRAEAAGIVDGFRAPGAQRSGDDGNAIQQIERALFEILAGDVFERLPAREPADAVAHLHVSGDGADARVDEMADEFADGVGLDRGVGVDGHDDAARSFRQGVRKRGGLAAVGLVHDAHGGISSELRVEQFAGAVVRSVIHDDHFQPRIVGLQHGIHRVDDDVFLVVGGNQHAHDRLKIRLVGRRRAGTSR